MSVTLLLWHWWDSGTPTEKTEPQMFFPLVYSQKMHRVPMYQCQAHSRDQEHWWASQGHSPYPTSLCSVQRETAPQKVFKYVYNCHFDRAERINQGTLGLLETLLTVSGKWCSPPLFTELNIERGLVVNRYEFKKSWHPIQITEK